MFYVYMIQNEFKDLYVGISENSQKRLIAHNSKQGAGFTKSKKKFSLVFEEKWSALSEARKREVQIKKWRRDKKEFLIDRFQKDFFTKPWPR